MVYDVVVLHPTIPTVVADYKNLNAEALAEVLDYWKGFFIRFGPCPWTAYPPAASACN